VVVVASQDGTDEVIESYPRYFPEGVVWNTHEETNPASWFLCDILNATNACGESRRAISTTHVKPLVQSSQIDILTAAALEKGWIREDLFRSGVVTVAQAHYERNKEDLPIATT